MLTVAVIIFVVMAIGALYVYAPPLLHRTRRIRRRTYTEVERKDQLKQALAAKRKLDFDAKVDWCNDFRQLTGGASYLDPDEPILAIRQGESVGVMSIQERVDALYRLADQGQLTCQHKWSYSLGYGVKQMYCTSCGRKG